jgi:succinate dehydrogenase/fumarate reductase flavoprotein subunit
MIHKVTSSENWDVEVDIVVVGYGAAGAVAAIEAAELGKDVLLLEKMPFPGGLSAASAGGLRYATNAEDAFAYLKATCAGRTPDAMLQNLAAGMVILPDYLRKLAKLSNATCNVTPALGNYPFPGYEALGYCDISFVPELEGQPNYHAVRPVKNGARLLKVLEDNVNARDIDVWFDAPARRLVRTQAGGVEGVVVERHGVMRKIRARGGVILSCGGFEADADMQNQYFQSGAIPFGSFRGNTGDGIRMAQAVGADLWHMWHNHGPYGVKHSDPDYPFAIYLKFLPMWTPGRTDMISDIGVEKETDGSPPRKALAKMAWIAVDRNGRRFMDEYPPYLGDFGLRAFDVFDAKTQSFPRIPGFVIFDEDGRKLYPLGNVVHNDLHPHYEWSADNLKEVENGIFTKASSIAELADKLELPKDELERTVATWNAAVDSGTDIDFGRQPQTMVPIATPPFYGARLYPIIINTQGGPRRNVHQQIVDPFGKPIDGLYAAGELGSVFGHLYMSGGNLAECFVSGWTAARHASERQETRKLESV